MALIRKISIGKDYKVDAMQYSVGQEVYGGHIIEAIIENLDIKKTLFSNFDKHFSTDTIFASNTSSFPISQLAEAVGLDRQKRFVGLHFFNPATWSY